MVRAALRDEDARPVGQAAKRRRSGDGVAEESLVAGHEDGEGGQGHRERHDLRDEPEGLAVGDDHAGRRDERGERPGELVLAGDEVHRLRVEHVANRLLLREDHPALGGGRVNRGHEHDHVAWREQVAHDARVERLVGGETGETLLELLDPLEGDGARIGLVCARGGPAVLGEKVALVANDEVGQAAALEQTDELGLGGGERPRRVGHEDGHVGAVEHAPRPRHALLAERARVVEARGVDDDHRPQGQDLHRLRDGVGRRAERVRDHGEVLTRHGVDQARLARVPQTEEPDVDPLARGRVSQSHVSSPSSRRRHEGRSPARHHVRPRRDSRWTPCVGSCSRCRSRHGR